MPDMWIDVDTAVTVPVNLMPLTDDTDFKTRETGIVYNQAGMDLVWNFQTPAGVTTQTAVTPTTAGDYDWTHSGDGMYKVEITASGGASINNAAEGFGWFSGICTGVLAWRGPVIGFRAAGLNDTLIENAYSATRGLAGTALPNAAADAAGGLSISAAGGLDLDAIPTHLTDIKGTGFVKDTDSLPQCRTATGFSTHSAADVWSVATRALTDKAGFTISGTKTTLDSLNDLSTTEINAECDTAMTDYGALKGGAAMTEDYAADGSTATPEQMFYMIWSLLSDFSISGTTYTAKKVDGSTTAMTFTLNDSTTPTAMNRAS